MHACDDQVRMSLHTAARDGNLEELKKLIADGKDLNARDKHQRTALVMASWAGKVLHYSFCITVLPHRNRCAR